MRTKYYETVPSLPLERSCCVPHERHKAQWLKVANVFFSIDANSSTIVYFVTRRKVKWLMNIIFLIFRKYDEIVSINDIPVTEGDQNLVRSLLDGALTTLNMVSLGVICAPPSVWDCWVIGKHLLYLVSSLCCRAWQERQSARNGKFTNPYDQCCTSWYKHKVIVSYSSFCLWRFSGSQAANWDIPVKLWLGPQSTEEI